jgi:hypothetical protein
MRKVLLVILCLLLTGCYGQAFVPTYGNNIKLSVSDYVTIEGLKSNGDIEFDNGFVIPVKGVYTVNYTMQFNSIDNLGYITSAIFINGVYSPIGTISAESGILTSSGVFKLNKGDKVELKIKSEIETTINLKNISFNIRR